MRKVIWIVLFSLLFFENAYAKNEFEIEGFKLGMLLSDKLTPEQINKGVKRNYYNQ